MTTQPTDDERMNAPTKAVRETFHAEFKARAIDFARSSLALLPELEGIAIIPSWDVPQDHLPAGIMMGREGKLVHPTEVYHMASKLQQVLKSLMVSSYEILVSWDAQLGNIAKEIRGKTEELARLNADIEAKTRERAATPGAAPGHPG